jgi:predicted ATPase/DNA-binding SARP family transcriptional activator
MITSEGCSIRLCFRMLGEFRISIDGVSVPDEAWSRRNAASVLKLLALASGHRLHREQVMEFLWPEMAPEQAANNLYQALHAARRALDVAVPGSSRALLLQDQIVQFATGVDLRVDVVAFERAFANAGEDSLELETAIALYQGPLLPNDRYEPWASERRELLARQYLDALERLAAAQESSADFQAALATLRRIVNADPLHEPAYRALMRIHARTGRRQQAVRAYQSLQDALQRDLDVEPEPETQDLYRRILDGEFAGSIPRAMPATPTWRSRGQHNLPPALNSFIGREREKAEVHRLLHGTRLLTLTGPGGCGKSRLSIEVAAEEVERHPDGVWLVELAALSNPDLIPQAIVQAIGIHEMPGRQVLETLGSWLRPRTVLLVIDNCEHMIDGCAAIVETLLRVSPGLTVLATSREPLRIDGETTSLIPSLSLPDLAEPQSVEQLLEYEAVQLFVDRATQVSPGFEMTEASGMTVAELCYRLDGIPLAIELAASRVRALSVEQIVERLSDRFQLLTSGSRTALSRQQTLRAALDWSYNLLGDHERILFARLSIFSGGCSLQAIEEVCAGSPLQRMEILDLLMLLVDRSLVVASLGDGTARYTLLETMREYGRERLAECGDLESMRSAHAGYYARLASDAAREIRGPDQRSWLRWLDREHDNFRQALDWFEARANGDGLEPALQLAGDLHWFWHLRGHYAEGMRRLARLLEHDRAGPSQGLGSALTGAGTMFMVVGEYAEAADYLNEAVEIWRKLDDPAGLSAALSWNGWIELFMGRLPAARERHAEALDLAVEAGDDWDTAMALLSLGIDSVEADEHEPAFAWFERSLELYRSINDYWGTTTTLQLLANLTYRTGDFAGARELAHEVATLERAEGGRWLEVQAQSLLGEIARAESDYDTAETLVGIALEISSEIGHVASRAWTLRDAGFIALARSEPEEAARHLMESLAIFQERSFQLGIACCLAGLAGVLTQQGDHERAAEILGTIAAGLDALQMAFAPADRLAVEDITSRLQQTLGPDRFDSALERGSIQPLTTVASQMQELFTS